MKRIQDVYTEITCHLLGDEKPSIYLNALSESPSFQQYPFNLLTRLKQTEQSPVHHPEGNVWIHTMMVVDLAAKIKQKSKNQTAFLWAALLHDLGKPDATKMRQGKITAYDHDKIGEERCVEFLSVLTQDESLIRQVSKLVRYHMQILFIAKNLLFSEMKQMKAETDVEEIALLGFCDRMGRTNVDRSKEEKSIQLFLKACHENFDQYE